MEINEIKQAIREQLNTCDDRDKLLDVLVKLIPDSPYSEDNMYAEEPETEYKSSSAVPKAHYKLLLEDRKKLLKGELQGKPWSEVFKRLKDRRQ
ncbi:hypothetical protein [Flavimarina sp. Hel_I_48]|uniref:hypothetical protein n=1 Tax=Flavimarina sp. Hel_I_48 TaxID=1392488 RepID=UPI0004DF4FA4|nr:hypothetical protein [Flavimarina sp. Hel_I_48]